MGTALLELELKKNYNAYHYLQNVNKKLLPNLSEKSHFILSLTHQTKKKLNRLKQLKNKILPSYRKKKYFSQFNHQYEQNSLMKSAPPTHNFLSNPSLSSNKKKTKFAKIKNSAHQKNLNQKILLKRFQKSSKYKNFKSQSQNGSKKNFGFENSRNRTNRHTSFVKSKFSNSEFKKKSKINTLRWRSTDKKNKNLANCFSTYRYMSDVYLR